MLNVTPTEVLEQMGVPTEVKNTVERARMMDWFSQRYEAGKKRPSCEIVTLTPVLAQILLEHNPINRPIRRVANAKINNEIVSGRWKLNGESIVVSKEGLLLNGQHRCLNVVTTGVSIPIGIWFGVEEEARYTIDTGSGKTARDFLAMKDYRDSAVLSAAIGNYIQYKKLGRLDHSGNKPTATEIVEVAGRLKGFDESVSITAGAQRAKLASRAILSFCHYVFWKRSNRDAADLFMRKLIEGTGLQHGDPIFYCMHKLRAAQRGVTANAKSDLVFRTWNLWRKGEQVGNIKMGPWQGPLKLPKVES